MNDKLICFAITATNELMLEECILYISQLNVPDGYEVEIISAYSEKDIAETKNDLMHSSDAKYKIYINDCTFILYKDILGDIIRIFSENEKVGAIGSRGNVKVPKHALLMESNQVCGGLYLSNSIPAHSLTRYELDVEANVDAEILFDDFFATQYDLEWQAGEWMESIFSTASQCIEFKKSGYKCVVAPQKELWLRRLNKPLDMNIYDKDRAKFIVKYGDYIDSGRLRVLFVQSEQIDLLGLASGFMDLGHELIIAEQKVNLSVSIPQDVSKLKTEIQMGMYDLVSTYDFCPGVADACHAMHVPYYSWVYDSPLLEVYMKQSRYPECYFSVFDKKQYIRLKESLHLKNILYVPLAAEVDIFGSVSIEEDDFREYASDVSFVGRLYSKRGYEEMFLDADEKYKQEADGIVESCNCIWDGETNLFDKASDDLIDYLAKTVDVECFNLYDIDKRYYFESMKLVRKCNEIERVKILTSLASKYKTTLYTDKPEDVNIPYITLKPWAHYWNVMPKVFYISKINLNITSRSIESGIPQRVIDIMAVGGFVLTNYQPEIEEYFTIGEDLDVYHDLDELMQKVDYYLNHKRERIRIAMNGYKKVKKNFSYPVALDKVIPFIFDDVYKGDK